LPRFLGTAAYVATTIALADLIGRVRALAAGGKPYVPARASAEIRRCART
jgi:hypothetical protein